MVIEKSQDGYGISQEPDFQEVCPHCDYINDIKWDGQSHKATCECCGRTILLCSLCDMDSCNCNECQYKTK